MKLIQTVDYENTQFLSDLPGVQLLWSCSSFVSVAAAPSVIARGHDTIPPTATNSKSFTLCQTSFSSWTNKLILFFSDNITAILLH